MGLALAPFSDFFLDAESSRFRTGAQLIARGGPGHVEAYGGVRELWQAGRNHLTGDALHIAQRCGAALVPPCVAGRLRTSLTILLQCFREGDQPTVDA